MKDILPGLSQRYVAALRKHLKSGAGASLIAALSLGRDAETLGLDVMQLALVHKRALAELKVSTGKNGISARAKSFLAKAIAPMEKTCRTTRKASSRLQEVNQALDRRAVELAAGNRSLKQGIARQKDVETALRKSEGFSTNLLKESRRLQKHLQRLTHQLLLVHEDRRKKISRKLRQEIAQTLLGINVRMLNLKKEAAGSASNFNKEIASTQQVVGRSIQTINRFARELNIRQKT